jgi:hypothetical protein
MPIEITGIPDILVKLTRMVEAPVEPLYQALRHEGNQIITVAQTLVPVDTGLLRSTLGVDSGALEAPRRPGGVVEVTLRGGAHGTAPYAARIEFDVTLNHPHGGQAHYLQQPLFQATAGFADRIATALQGALRTR